MMFLARNFIRSLFVLVFLLTLLTSTLSYRLLDKDFLFTAFEGAELYENLPEMLASSLSNDANLSEEEKVGITTIVQNINPELAKSMIENNLAQVLDYIHGETSTIHFYIPTAQMGIPEMTEDFDWSLEESTALDLKEKIKLFNGSFVLLQRGLWILGGLLGVLMTLYALMSRPKVFPALSHLLLYSGSSAVFFGLVGKIVVSQIPTVDPRTREPAEILVDQLMKALLPGIFSFWLTIGLILSGIAVLIKVVVKLNTDFNGAHKKEKRLL